MQLGGLGSALDWRSHQGIRQSKLCTTTTTTFSIDSADNFESMLLSSLKIVFNNVWYVFSCNVSTGPHEKTINASHKQNCDWFYEFSIFWVSGFWIPNVLTFLGILRFLHNKSVDNIGEESFVCRFCRHAPTLRRPTN